MKKTDKPRRHGGADEVDKPEIRIPLELFRDLVWLQAFYAAQINCRDGGERRPLRLSPALAKQLTDREVSARAQTLKELE